MLNDNVYPDNNLSYKHNISRGTAFLIFTLICSLLLSFISPLPKIYASATDNNGYEYNDFSEKTRDEQATLLARIKDDELLECINTISFNEEYDSKGEVASYLILFERLPNNYHRKKDRNYNTDKLSPAGNVYMIGGDRFLNLEGLLPEAKDRKYFECDLYDNELKRGKYRLVYSNDGLIYYTDDHYKSFSLIVDISSNVNIADGFDKLSELVSPNKSTYSNDRTYTSKETDNEPRSKGKNKKRKNRKNKNNKYKRSK